MEKLLDSDWLRTVQFKCNASAKSATPVTVFKKLKLHLPKRLVQFFCKTPSRKLIPNLTRNRMITYTNYMTCSQ